MHPSSKRVAASIFPVYVSFFRISLYHCLIYIPLALGNVPLIEVAFLELYKHKREVKTKFVKRAAPLKFLLSIFQDSPRNLNYYATYPPLLNLIYDTSNKEALPFIDIFRIILRRVMRTLLV
jgi:hypothetical protein